MTLAGFPYIGFPAARIFGWFETWMTLSVPAFTMLVYEEVLGQTVHLDGITLFMPAIALALMLIRPCVSGTFGSCGWFLDPLFGGVF